MNSTFDQVEHHDFNMDCLVDFYDSDQISTFFTAKDDYPGLFSLQFSPPRFPSDEFVTTTEESNSLLSSIPYPSTMYPADSVSHAISNDSQQIMSTNSDFFKELERLMGLEFIWDDKIEGTCGDSEESLSNPTNVGVWYTGQDPFFLLQQMSRGEDSLSPSQSMISESLLTDVVSLQSSLTLPGEDMEIDNQLSLFHLLKAYGEALEKDQRELGQVILRRISEKGCPVGKTLERLAFYLSQDSEINQGENLKQESLKNFKAAFHALYQALPDGKFAHFAANSAILEAIPDDVETIDIKKKLSNCIIQRASSQCQ